ncbi:MAG: siphovirus ReqiPepy6 Gp37-like family protein, partial [Gammaproteobacteria bacterium]|nr:siphovirus ReqiPepy6 Gp37-like family protein [Gammaproteobacteria bacterium]
MFLLDKYSSVYYSRCANILSTIQMSFPFKEWFSQVKPFFSPDWRIDVWRSPGQGYPMRREEMYMLRKAEIYTRKSDDVQMIILRGRNGMELLNRRTVIQYEETSYTEKTDYIDDMMKAIVREQCLYGSCINVSGVVDNDRGFPVDEFVVQADLSLGPETTISCSDRVVFDILKELRETSFALNYSDSTKRKIYY